MFVLFCPHPSAQPTFHQLTHRPSLRPTNLPSFHPSITPCFYLPNLPSTHSSINPPLYPTFIHPSTPLLNHSAHPPILPSTYIHLSFPHPSALYLSQAVIYSSTICQWCQRLLLLTKGYSSLPQTFLDCEGAESVGHGRTYPDPQSSAALDLQSFSPERAGRTLSGPQTHRPFTHPPSPLPIGTSKATRLWTQPHLWG